MMSICGPETENNYKTFEQWSDQNPDTLFVPLSNHQGMALEFMDEVVSSFTYQNKSISEDLKNDLASNFQASDGSNSCVYLCTKIADELLKCEEVSALKIASLIQNVAEETIRSLPNRVNHLRKVSDYADVYDALQIMNQHAIINTQYTTTEILAKQSSDNLEDKQRHLKSALKSLEKSKNAEGKAFAVYTCNPYAILVGVVRSTFIIIDTHKVHEEVGGKDSGLLVLFNLKSIQKDDVLDGVVNWISLRMKRSITDYSTKLHSLVLLQAKSDVGSVDEDEFVISDSEDQDILNASIEIERHLQCIASNDCVEVEEKENDRPQNEKVNKIKPDFKDHKIGSRVCLTSSKSKEKDHSPQEKKDTAAYLTMRQKPTETVIADAGEVEHLYETPEMEPSEGSPPSNITNKNDHGNYTLPEELPAVKEDDLIVWKGHLTKFGLNSLNDFQIQAIQSVQLGRDVIVVQPTGSGKSLCFQLPSLFEREKFVVVITPTISLINSQIEGLKKVNIDAIALGRPAGQDAQLNHDRLFNNNNGSSFPSIVFTTPEHFVNRVSYNLERIKTNVKLLVLDEVHKMFDRNSDFRSSYDFFKGIKDSFSCVPVMTLTATLSQTQVQSLCADYLKNPVLIKGSINRSNIKLNIKSYVTSKKKKSSRSAVKENTKEDIWSECATDIKNITGDEYAIVYMDFRSDVELMTSSLKLLLGEENVRPYYGKGMTHDVKKKTDSAFRGKEFQVLVATESYEVGTHSPHVDNIFRVGCMRNLSVMIQEFGRAGRSGNNADGFLLINETKDDQRLAFWTKNCSKSEEEQIKAQLIQSWRWVHSIYCGRCMREEIISKFGEGQLELQCVDECCSSCDIKDKRDFNAKEAIRLLIQAVLDLGLIQAYKEGVKEEVLIGWLRGSKKDTFSLPEMQKIMEETQTYSAGTKTFEDRSSQGWWSRVLRQAINLQLIDIKYNIIRCTSFTRVWRQYKVSEKGKQFLDSPYDILVLDPINDPFDQKTKQKEVVTRARTGRGHHHLPKIKDCLKNSANWIELTLKDQYEFPGFDTSSATSQPNFIFVKDYRKLSFAPSTRPHFIWDDNQLSKRSTQTAKHNIVIDGVDTSLNVRRGSCEGVKKCTGPDCSYVVSNRQKVNRCVHHRDSHSLVSTGPCPAHMVYIWPSLDDGRRWIGVVPGTQHNHSKPAPHILSSKVKEDIRKVVSDDSTKSTKDIMKGFGIGYVPAEASSPAANADRVRRERKMALGKWMSFHKELRPLDEILGFDKIRKKVEGNQLYDEGTNISEKVNKMMGQYQMEGSEYIFTPARKYAFFMSPFQSSLLSRAEDLFMDVTYTGNDFFPYLLNIVTFNDQTCVYNAVARVLCSRQDGETYAKSITTIFDKVSHDHAHFSKGAKLRSILVDFDDAQYKGLKECLGEELAKKVIRGCSVHWQRSVNRVCKLVCQSEDETRIFKNLARKIEEERDKENIYLIFDVLSGSRKLQDAKQLIECDLSSELDKLDNHNWTKLKHWSKWWCRLNHLAMFTRAFKEMEEKDWEEGPCTTNPVEALNRQSLQEGCTILHTLMENIYLEDRLQAVKTAVCEDNVTTSYRASPGKPKSKRKRTSIGNSGDEGPPDKRRHIISQKRRPNGRALIKRVIEVEYDEKNKSGKVTKYWGWCKGQIVAYRKHEGYLVKFEDIIADDGTVVAGWSDWIADLNSKDVRLLDP